MGLCMFGWGDIGDVEEGQKKGPVNSTKIYQVMAMPDPQECAKFWSYKEDSNPETDHREVPAFGEDKVRWMIVTQ